MIFFKLFILILCASGAGWAGLELSNFSRYRIIYNKGVEALSTGNFKMAEKAFKKVFHLAPDMEENTYNLGLTYFRMNKLELALQFFMTTLELNPKEVDAYYNIGLIHYLRNKKKETIKYFNQILELSDKTDEQTLFGVATVYVEIQNYDLGIEAVKKLIETSPSSVDYRMMMADIYEKIIADTGNIQSFDFLIQTYKDVLLLDEEFEPANIKLANCYAKLGQTENCKDICARILKKNTKCADALFLMGIMDFAIRQYQTAASFFEQAFAAKSGLKQAYLSAAHCYRLMGNPQKAKDLWEQFKSKASSADITESSEQLFDYEEVKEEDSEDTEEITTKR